MELYKKFTRFRQSRIPFHFGSDSPVPLRYADYVETRHRLWVLMLASALCFSNAATAQNTQITVFGEGVFTPQSTGGLGGRIGYRVVPAVDLEGEFSWNFHSEAVTVSTGQKFYNTGYNFLGGARLRLPVPFVHLFAAAKGGFLHSTTHPEDETQPSLPSITSTAAYFGGGTEIGGSYGLRFDAGDLLLFKSDLRRNNLRITGGIFFRF